MTGAVINLLIRRYIATAFKEFYFSTQEKHFYILPPKRLHLGWACSSMKPMGSATHHPPQLAEVPRACYWVLKTYRKALLQLLKSWLDQHTDFCCIGLLVLDPALEQVRFCRPMQGKVADGCNEGRQGYFGAGGGRLGRQIASERGVVPPWQCRSDPIPGLTSITWATQISSHEITGRHE